MTGDSEHESEGAGGSPAPTSADSTAADERANHPRPFRSWASAHEEEKAPSVLSRIGQRISGMFSKSKSEADAEPVELEAAPIELEAESVELENAPAEKEKDIQWIESESAVELEAAAPEPPPLIEHRAADAEQAPPVEPESATAPEAEITSEPVVMWEPDAPPASEPVVMWQPDAPVTGESASAFETLSEPEIPAEAPTRPMRRSLIARLFGRKPKPVEDAPVEGLVVELPAEELEEPARGEPVLEELAGDEASVEEPAREESVFKTPVFDELPVEEAEDEFPVEEPEIEEPAFDATDHSVETIPEAAAEPQRPGFFARLFGRKPEPVVEVQPDEEALLDAPVEGLVVELPAEELEEPARGEPVFEEPAGDEASVEEPAREELVFKTPVFDELPVEEAEDELPVEEPEIEESVPDATDLSVETIPEAAAAPQRPGFFARLFGRKPEPVVEVQPDEEALLDAPVDDEEIVRTNEYPIEVAPEATGGGGDEPFASVDEALPLEREPYADDVLEPVDSVPATEAKAGFFARLFGGKSKPAARPSLEIEVHEDRIEAAAHALDEVSGESFSSGVTGGGHRTAEETFASVEEALPYADEPLPEVDLPHRPAQESTGTLEIEPFDPFSIDRDSRDTAQAEADADAEDESRSTIEMQQEARSTVEVQQDFSDTLEIDEKTDEFEVPTLDMGAPAEPADQGPDTLEVSKQSWIAKLFGFRKKEQEAGVAAGAAATVLEGNPVFLFSKFRAFYNEIIRFKHQKSEFTAGFATAIVTDYAADLSPDAAADAQSKQLVQMLELQMAEANWMGGEAKERYPDAQYAMAVLADELFTHMEWEGQTAWPKHLLEVKLYKTHAADVELFKRMDKLLKEQPNSLVARDLARVYLLVIAAGFQGKFRPFGLTRALADYRQRLYEYIHLGDPLMLYAPDRKIFPEAAARTLEGHAVSRFSAAQRWAAILVFLLVGYTALAHFAWNRVSADLKDVTARIRTAGATTGTGVSAPTSANSNSTGAR